MGARRIFVDGVAGAPGVLGGGGGLEARDVFHVLVEGLQRENLTAVLAVEATAFSDAASGGAAGRVDRRHGHPAADGGRDPGDGALDRDRQVARPRLSDGAALPSGSSTVAASKSTGGCRRLGRADRDEAAAFDPTTRVTTGMPGLDALVNGGYFLGSTTVVAGISGVGKSVHGTAIHGRRRAARRAQPHALARRAGPADPPQRHQHRHRPASGDRQRDGQGPVRPPQEIEIDHHFHNVERIVEEFKPKRVLFDSLSTYGSNLGTEGRMFRDFFHALVALMKEHQTATVYNHENPEMLGMSSMMGDFAMSSLVDNIMLMNWIELGDAFRLGLTVAKMRANPNARTTHECEIVDGKGLRVLPREIPARRAAVFQLSEPDLAQPGAPVAADGD